MRTTILSLPMETLREIVDYAVDERHTDMKQIDWDAIFDCRKTIKSQRVISMQTVFNLRLISKRFYDAASHLLVPVLRIQLDEASLQRAEEISKVSQVAAGVKEVELILPYCPDNLACDLQTFTKFKIDQFDYMEESSRNSLTAIGDALEHEEYLETDEESDEEPFPPSEEMASDDNTDVSGSETSSTTKQLEQDPINGMNFVCASKKWLAMRAAWEDAIAPDGQELAMDADKRILHEGFERFRALYGKQHHLVTTGTFATRLGAILSRLSGVEWLNFKDETSDLTDEAKDMRFVKILLDADKIIDNLAEPMRWATACGIDAGPDVIFATIKAAALLWDVPIALHRAGVRFRKLNIQCFPGDRKFELESAANGFLKGTEVEFRNAFSSLDSFHFSPKSLSQGVFAIDLEAFTIGQEHQIIHYLKLCTSGAQLRDLCISFEHFRCMTMKLNRQDELLLSLDDVLESMGSTRLNTIQVESASVPQAGILGLCERLGPQTTRVSLTDLNLQIDSWPDVLQALRSAIGPRVAQGKCRFDMANFDTAELERYYKTLHNLQFLLRGQLVDIMSEEGVYDEVCDYVAGILDENPLSKYQENLE